MKCPHCGMPGNHVNGICPMVKEIVTCPTCKGHGKVRRSKRSK
jgi:hypothetical protein